MTDDVPAHITILAFVADHPGIFGRHRAARILTGNITEEDIDRVPSLRPGAAIPATTQAAVLRFIDTQLAAGVLDKSYGDRPRLVLTRKGWSYLAALELLHTTGEPHERTIPTTHRPTPASTR